MTLLPGTGKIRHVAKPWFTRSSYVALGFILLLDLLISATPAGATAVATDELRWSPVNIPTEGKAGNWVLAAGSDVQHLAQAIDGSLYASVSGLTYTLYKSTNSGYAWSYVGNVRDSIVDVATSPHDAGWLYYATASRVYRSSDGGKTFVQLPGNPGGAGSGNVEITSIAVSWQNAHVIAVGTRDTDASQFGGVYTISEDQIFSGWTSTDLSGYDVYCVALSVNYPADRQIVAVATNEIDTYVMTRIGYAGWGATSGNARLVRDNSIPPTPIVARSAAVAFPDDYRSDSGNSVLFVAIDAGGNGDVYRVSLAVPGSSLATDLNIGYTYGLRNIDVTDLAMSGNANSARLLAGAAASAQTYYSSDGGRNWARSSKEPTGSSKTRVLMTGSGWYAAARGSESALSISQNSGATWNQVSLIDTAVSAIVDLSPSPIYSEDGTLFMLSFGGKHSLWRTINGAASWERVFSGALAGVDSMSRLQLSPRYGRGSVAVFVAGSSNGRTAVWQSSDNGQRFNCRPAVDPGGSTPLSVDAWSVVNDTSLFIASYDGANALVYYSENGGFFYLPGVVVGRQPLTSIGLSPGYDKDRTILIGDANGGVYWSADNGTTFELLPPVATSPPLSGAIAVAFDSKFGSNKTVYAASSTANKGVYRFIVGKSSGWEAIDGTLPGGGMISQLMVSTDGVLYAANSRTGGSMERSLDPAYPLGPTFDTVTRSLDTNATLSGLWQSGHKIWAVDTTNARLLSFTDTLTLAPVVTSPRDAASGAGSLINHTIKNVALDWETLTEASSYQWQLSYNASFSTVPSGFDGTTDGSSAHLPTLEPGTTYFWRVRASAPVLSPWSAKRSFTTSLDTEVIPLKLLSPEAGAVKVSTTPLFQWGPIAGADAYELLVSTDLALASPSIARTGDNALPATAWQCSQSLKSDTVHYWKVRAINRNTASAWSAVSSFTTDILLAVPKAASLPLPTTPPPLEPPATAKPQPTPTATFGQLSATPAAPATPQPQQPAPVASLLPTVLNWIAYLVGALLLAIMLLLVIVLVLVVRMKR